MSTFGAEHAAAPAADHSMPSLRALVANRMHASDATGLDPYDSTTFCMSDVSAGNSGRHTTTVSTALSHVSAATPRDRESSESDFPLAERSQIVVVSSASTATLSAGRPIQHAKRKISKAAFDSIGSIDNHTGFATASATLVDTIGDCGTTAAGTAGVTLRGNDEGGLAECDTVLLASMEQDEARRRWGLVRMHVALMKWEKTLRWNMWQVAINAARNPLAPAASSSETLSSSFCLDEIKRSAAERTVESCHIDHAKPEPAAAPLQNAVCTAQSQNNEEARDAFGAGLKQVLAQLQQRKFERVC